MRIKGPETRHCPAEFQDRVTRMFGRNEFGDPLFKIVWGQAEFHRMGNVWRDKAGNERWGYRERYLCHGNPCWVILRWKTPKEYGSPRAFYSNTFDQVSGLYIMGEYPWRGRYEVFQPLMRTEYIAGKMVVEHFPLSHILIDRILPMMIAAQSMSLWERKAARDLVKQQEEKQLTEEIADRMANTLPAWFGPVSFSRQGCRTSLIDRKMEQLKSQWDRMSRSRRLQFQKGFFQAPRPMIVN